MISLLTLLLLLNGCAHKSPDMTYDSIKQEVLGIVAATENPLIGDKLLAYYVSQGLISPEQAYSIMIIYHPTNEKEAE